ncbi:unnamed protein product, partial [Symbiodinium microadriaticum]
MLFAFAPRGLPAPPVNSCPVPPMIPMAPGMAAPPLCPDMYMQPGWEQGAAAGYAQAHNQFLASYSQAAAAAAAAATAAYNQHMARYAAAAAAAYGPQYSTLPPFLPSLEADTTPGSWPSPGAVTASPQPLSPDVISAELQLQLCFARAKQAAPSTGARAAAAEDAASSMFWWRNFMLMSLFFALCDGIASFAIGL